MALRVYAGRVWLAPPRLKSGAKAAVLVGCWFPDSGFLVVVFVVRLMAVDFGCVRYTFRGKQRQARGVKKEKGEGPSMCTYRSVFHMIGHLCL